MYKKLFLLIYILSVVACVFAQENDPVVIRINGKPICKSEVERVYKNGNTENKEDIKNFIQSYIDFKLNVDEAIAQRLDTTPNYKRDYSSYRLQMAAPFLVDTLYEEQYLKKIYNRLLEDVEVNHVMFPFEKQDIVLPSDTAVLYKKAMEARSKILKNGFLGEEFNTPRSRSAFIARPESRNGYMGWITPFMLPSKVEDAIYSLSLKEVSMPIRSARGYHIIQVLNKRPAKGSAEIEQVLFGFSHIPPKQHQIDSVRKVAMREYDKIHSATDFQSLCDEFSRAHQTGDKGCYFGVVGLDSNLPLDFTMTVFNLENPGDISKPVISDYGFHIIRLISRIPVPTFEKVREELRQRIIRSDKVQNLSDEKRARLNSMFNITINRNAYAKLNDLTTIVSPRDSLFLSMIKNQDETLLDIEGKRAYAVSEFAKYIQFRQKERQRDQSDLQMTQIEEVSPYSLSTDVLKEYFDSFLNVLVSDYADYTLEEREPQFAEAMKQFSEGLLFFAVKDQNVWNRSKTDKAGLTDYFLKNKKKYSLDEVKYKGVVIYAKNEDVLKQVEAIYKKNPNRDQFIQEIRSSLNKDSISVKIESGLWVKGNNTYVDNKIFGGAEPKPYNGYPYFFVAGKFIDKPEDYTDVRNVIELDYQEVLDKNWTAYLRNKYKVEIDKTVLNTIK